MDRYGPTYLFLMAVALVGCVVEAPGDETPMDMAEATGGSRSGDAADETMGASDERSDENAPPACGNEDELAPNQSRASAHVVEASFDRNDLFLCPGTSDYFRLELLAGQAISITLVADPEELAFDLVLTNEAGEPVEEARSEGGREALETIVENEGVYFIKVEGSEDAAGFYGLSISGSCTLDAQCSSSETCDRFQERCVPVETSAVQGDDRCGGDDYEPNDRDDEGFLVDEFPAQANGRTCQIDADWFTFVLEGSASIDVLARFTEGEDIDLFVIDAENGQTMGSAIADRRTNPERIELSHLPAGTYRIGVNLFVPEDEADREVEYSLEITVEPSEGCNIDRDCRSDALPLCVDGTCQAPEVVPISEETLGSVCTDDDDCRGEDQICWTGGPGGHDNICTRRCGQNDGCEDVGRNSYCAGVMRGVALCVPGCGSDDECGIFYACENNRCEIRGDCRTNDDCGENELCQPSRYGDRYCSLPIPAATCGADPDYDPNDQTTEASPFPMGELIAELQICNDDNDWYTAVVTEEQGGQTLEVELSFQDGSDMDVYVYDEDGNMVGEATSPDQLTERVRIRLAQPGNYLVRVDQFESVRIVDNTYSLRMEVLDADEACTAAGNECASTSPLRLRCDPTSGGCVSLDGAGQIAPGEACDSSDDCAETAPVCWISNDPNFSLCSHVCQNNRDCEDVPGASCQRVGRRQRLCLPNAF